LDYIRMIHYPATDYTAEDQFGLGAHMDGGFLTFLPQTKVPGLEIQTQEGTWIPQPVVPGAFLVNAGQILRRWTNDRFRATPHRVVSPTGGQDRYSVPFFFNPAADALVEVPASCVTADNPLKHQPIRYADHLAQYLSKTYTK